MTIGVILSGGVGQRFQSHIPKQYMSLNGKLIIQYVIDAFQESKLFDKIIISCNSKYISLLKNTENIIFVEDGATRNISIENAIKALPKNTKYVLFHDACRPFITANDLNKYLISLKSKKYNAVVTSTKIVDALYNTSKIVNRENFRLIQTPEAFAINSIKSFNVNKAGIAIYENLTNTLKLDLIELAHANFKITYPKDIFMAEQLLKYKEVVKSTSNVENKRILVLGASGGIGKEIVSQLKKQKANVVAYGRKELDLSNTFKIGTNDRFDCVIHSAGAYATDAEGLSNNYDKIMDVNFRSVVLLVDGIEDLIKPGGSLIVLGSTAGAYGRKGISIYSASKSALNTFVEGIQHSLKEKNIRIQVICPAKVNTQLQKKINPNANIKDMISPEKIAKIVIGYIDNPSTGNIVYIRVGQE